MRAHVQSAPSPDAVASVLRELSSAAEELAQGAAQVVALSAAIPERCMLSRARAEGDVAALVAEIRALGAAVVADCARATADKHLTALWDHMDASKEMLEAGALLCALEEGTGRWQVQDWALQSLLAAPPPLLPPCALRIHTQQAECYAALAAAVCLCQGVDVAQCSASGDGVCVFLPGPDAVNTIHLRCCDAAGMPVACVRPSDVSVRVEGGVVTAMEPTEPGVITATYTLPHGVAQALLWIYVCGTPLPDIPFTLFPPCAALGMHYATIHLENDNGNSGLAVTRDHAHMIVTNESMKRVYVYSLPEGRLLRSFGGKGTAPGRFTDPVSVCVTSGGSLLVAESLNRRLQEVSLAGKHIRFLTAGLEDKAVYGADMSECGDLVAVNTYHAVILLKYACGSRLRMLALSFNCRHIRFAPASEGGHLLLALGDKGVEVRTVRGEIVTIIVHNAAAAVDVVCVGNRVLMLDTAPHHCVSVFEWAEGERHWEKPMHPRVGVWGAQGLTDGLFMTPDRMVADKRFVYVLDQFSKRVQVFL